MGSAADGPFSTIGTAPAGVVTPEKYSGAARVGALLFFAPMFRYDVGVFDTTTSTFSTVTIGCCGGYNGAAAVGTTVYFAPFFADDVGVLDTTFWHDAEARADPERVTFSKISTKEAGVTHDGKYEGAVAVGTKVYFAPLTENNIGVVDTVTSTFSTISVACPHQVDVGFDICISGKYSGGAAVGTSVYFAPSAEDNILVLDTETNRTSKIYPVIEPLSNNPVKVAALYSGAVAVGKTVFFVPHDQGPRLRIERQS